MTGPDHHDAWVARLANLAVGLLIWRVLVLLHGYRFEEFAAGELAILHGQSFSPAFANRWLGPALLDGIAAVTGLAPGRAFGLLTLVLLLAGQGLAFEVYRRLLGEPWQAWRTSVLSGVALLLMVDPAWLKSWDFLDYLVLTALAHGVVAQANLGYFAGLFLAALPNRESALFIPLWLVVAAFEGSGWRWHLAHRRRLLAGLGLLVAGGVAVVAVRRWAWTGGDALPASATPLGNHFLLLDNLRTVSAQVTRLQLEGLVTLALVGFAAVVAWRWQRMSLAQRQLAVVLAAMAVANLCFGLVDETRVWWTCVPLAVAAVLDRVAEVDRRISQTKDAR